MESCKWFELKIRNMSNRELLYMRRALLRGGGDEGTRAFGSGWRVEGGGTSTGWHGGIRTSRPR